MDAKIFNFFAFYLTRAECHRAVTPATQRLLSEFFANSLWYGFTGTPRFDVNAYDAQGDLPRTTDELYSNGAYRNTERYQKLLAKEQLPYCLHKYTVREAIRDNAVLGFTTEHLGASHLKEDDSNEDVAFYDTETHMLSVLDVILNKSREKLGFANGKGQTYEALLTVRSIKIAQKYYELLKRVKNGETELTICEETRKVLPDFPKFAITYSVSSDADDESSDVNVPQMKSALDDYNEMFDTHFGIGEIQSYNANLNERLARKGERYKNRAEQLDLVIVVNRLLTGFDAPCLSTVFIDRQPMHPHDIIQTFSRTNRLFDKRKQSGQIVTFQSPHIFKKAVDDALVLYSAGGEASALAPDWDASLEEFNKSLAYLRLVAPTPEVLGTYAKPQKLRFLKAFQEFDKVYTNLKAFTRYAEQEPDSCGITQDEYERYAAWYKNIKEELKPDPPEEPDTPDYPDMDYELMAYSREKIDYDYIVALIQSVASASGEERKESHYQNLMKEINSYIDDLRRDNPKLGTLMQELWSKVQESPEEFENTRVSYVLETMRNEAIIRVVRAFAQEWCVPETAIMYAAQRMEPDADVIPGLNNIKDSADYAKYVETHDRIAKFKYNQSVKKALAVMLREEVLPLRFDDYQVQNQTALYEFPHQKEISYVAEDYGKYDT